MLDDFSKQKTLSSVLDPSKSHRKYLSKKSLLSRHICSQPIIRIDRKLVNHKVCLSRFYNEVDIYIYILLCTTYLNIDHISFIIRIKILLIQSSFCCLPGLFIYTWLEYTYGYTCQDWQHMTHMLWHNI